MRFGHVCCEHVQRGGHVGSERPLEEFMDSLSILYRKFEPQRHAEREALLSPSARWGCQGEARSGMASAMSSTNGGSCCSRRCIRFANVSNSAWPRSRTRGTNIRSRSRVRNSPVQGVESRAQDRSWATPAGVALFPARIARDRRGTHGIVFGHPVARSAPYAIGELGAVFASTALGPGADRASRRGQFCSQGRTAAPQMISSPDVTNLGTEVHWPHPLMSARSAHRGVRAHGHPTEQGTRSHVSPWLLRYRPLRRRNAGAVPSKTSTTQRSTSASSSPPAW